jgi:hypothetical protein
MNFTEFYNKFQHLLCSSIGSIWDNHEFLPDEKIDFDFIHHSHPIYTIEGIGGIFSQTENPVFDDLEEIFNDVHYGKRMDNDIILKEIDIYMAIQQQKTIGWANRVPTTILHRFLHIRQIYNILFGEVY